MLWGRFWTRPQAILWERHGLEHEVALHVRCLVRAELPDCPTSDRTLVRQQAAELLLTMPAMLAAQVKIGAPRPTAVPDLPAEDLPAPTQASASALQARLTVVKPDSVGA